MQPRFWLLLAATGILLAGRGEVRADDSPDVVPMQKETAQANWKRLFGDEAPVHEETKHFLLYGPTSMTARQLKALGTALEAQYALALKPLEFEANEELWPGKLTVYLFGQRDHFTSFVRGIEKRRPDPDDRGSYLVEGARSHIAAGPPQEKYDPSVEDQAGEQLGALMIAKKAGKDVPDWVVTGFGRATEWRANPKAYAADRAQLMKLLKAGAKAKDAWNPEVPAQDRRVLRASVVGYLAYGPTGKSFPSFLEAYKPDEEKKEKTAWDALRAIKSSPDRLNQGWRSWAAAGR